MNQKARIYHEKDSRQTEKMPWVRMGNHNAMKRGAHDIRYAIVQG